MHKQTLSSAQTGQLSRVRGLTGLQLHTELNRKRSSEKELLAEIIIYIYEVDRRKLFLNYHCTNLFDYLVKVLGYCNASAQRRIDAARLLQQNPEVAGQLASGELNLTQVSIVAQGLRQARREAIASGLTFASTPEEKIELLEKVKSQPKDKAQAIVAQALKLEVKAFEKKTLQRDESLRLEVTFSKDEADLLKEGKDLLSHTQPSASYKEVIVAALFEFKKKRDPAKKVTYGVTSAAEVRRSIFRRDKNCQWKFENGQVCGSTFQLQVDHKRPRWLGGSNEQGNLQLLCSAHNKLKYQKEAGFR